MQVLSWRRPLLAGLITPLLLMGTPAPVTPAQADETAPTKVLLLLDVSGSMNAKLAGGGTKFQAAKKALKEVAGALPAGTQVGLRVYGSEIAEDQKVNPKACTDTRLVLPVGPLDRAKMNRAVDSFTAKGETPIAYSLEKSVDDLGGSGKRVLVLISDGQETCAKDPCPTARKLAKSGVDLQFNAIGLAVGSKARKQLQCIADAGGGSYYDASEADDLSEVIRKITQRALRPFQLTGIPVRATPEPETAPSIRVGQYLDRYEADKKLRYYRIERNPGSTVTASITSINQGRGSGSSDFWNLELRTESGRRCGAESAAAGNYNRVGVLAGAVSSLTSAAAVAPTADGCATEPLLLGLTRSTVGGYKAAVPVEVRISEEPAVTNLAALPPSITSFDASKTKKVAARGPVRPVVGGSSFSNAAELAPGSWRDSLAVGETVLYRVRLETGQRLRVTLDAPAPKSSWRLSGAETIAADLQLYTTTRVDMRQDFEVLQLDDVASLEAVTPEIRVRNREFTSLTGGVVRGSSVAGDYYIAAGLQPGQRELTGRVMPVRLNVAVDGQPSGQPVYAAPSPEPTPTPTPTGGSTPGTPTSGQPPQTQDQPGGDRFVLGLVVGVGAVAVVGAALLVLARRRSRRS